MKQFLQDIVITLVIGIVVVVGIIVALIPHAKMNNSTFAYKREYVEQHRTKISTLIIGHSQTVVGLDASELDSAFNLAISARVSYYDAQLVGLYATQLPNLKAVLYPLVCEYEPGAALLGADSRNENIFIYNNYWNLSPPQYLLNPWKKIEYYHYYVSQVLHNRFYFQEKNCDSLGLISMGESVGDGNNVYDAPGCELLVTESLLKMAKVCNEHGVRLIVVTMPCNSTYRANHTDCDSRMQRLMEDIATEYPAVEYHCYLNDEQFGDSLFSDQTHLNHKGATAFARRIKQDFDL